MEDLLSDGGRRDVDDDVYLSAINTTTPLPFATASGSPRSSCTLSPSWSNVPLHTAKFWSNLCGRISQRSTTDFASCNLATHNLLQGWSTPITTLSARTCCRYASNFAAGDWIDRWTFGSTRPSPSPAPYYYTWRILRSKKNLPLRKTCLGICSDCTLSARFSWFCICSSVTTTLEDSRLSLSSFRSSSVTVSWLFWMQVLWASWLSSASYSNSSILK